jgi:hypothetical protein
MAAGYKSLFAFWMGGGGLVKAGFAGMLGFWFGGGGLNEGGDLPYRTLQGASGLPSGYRTLQGTRR